MGIPGTSSSTKTQSKIFKKISVVPNRVLRVLIKINSVYLRLESNYLALITSHCWWNFGPILKSIQSDDAFVMEAITVASGYVMTDGKCGPNNVDSPWGSRQFWGFNPTSSIVFVCWQRNCALLQSILD